MGENNNLIALKGCGVKTFGQDMDHILDIKKSLVHFVLSGWHHSKIHEWIFMNFYETKITFFKKDPDHILKQKKSKFPETPSGGGLRFISAFCVIF